MGGGVLFLLPPFWDNRIGYRKFGLGEGTGLPSDFLRSCSNWKLRERLQRFVHFPGDIGKAFLTLRSSDMKIITFLLGESCKQVKPRANTKKILVVQNL